MILTNRGQIKELLTRHGFTFSKALGQNFIVNPSICPRMAQEGGARPGAGVLEIGAGIGVLTAELASRADKVVCVELDSRLLPILDETLAEYSNVTVINQDVLKVDLHRLLREEFGSMPVAVCANLPYYITSPILMRLLEERLPVESVTVMVQKEAAARICARPGTRESGAVSAAVSYYSQPRVLFPVSRGSFLPPPNVDSCVIRLDLRSHPPFQVEEGRFFQVVRASFAQRRKTAANSLSHGLSIPKEQAAQAIAQAGLSPSVRPEQLTLEDFYRLTQALYQPQPGLGD